MTIEAADHRLLEIQQPAHDSPCIGEDVAELAGVVDHGLEPVHVTPGAEGPASPGQDDEVASGIVLEFAQQARELPVHGFIDGVRGADTKVAPPVPGANSTTKSLEDPYRPKAHKVHDQCTIGGI